MSIISELNPAGQTVLAGSASLATNAIVHPIGTIRSRIQANPNMKISGAIQQGRLYLGVSPVCAVDFASFGVAYLTNDVLQQHMPPLAAAVTAGVVSAPIEAFGEAFVSNRQVHALPFRSIIGRAFRPSGTTATIARQVPFITSVFYSAPRLQNRLEEYTTPLIAQATAGGVSGTVAGAITGPIDLIKTRVQTSEEYLPIRAAVEEVWREGGWRALRRGSGVRAGYIGLAVTVMNLVNNALPNIFPSALRNES